MALLESSAEPGAESRWSMLGWRPKRTLRWPAGRRGALDGLRAFLGSRRIEDPGDTPVPFFGGYLGWISYDIGRHIERLPASQPVDPSVPDFVLGEYEALLIEDRVERRLFLTGVCERDEGPSRIVARQAEAIDAFQELDRSSGNEEFTGPAATVPRPDIDRDEYLRRVERVLEYVRAGDIFQANLAQVFRTELAASLVDVYGRLRRASPNPYGCFLDQGGPAVLSISPELFLARRGTRVETRPIKGTRPRGADPESDARLREELRTSEKDRAELAMIVDLLRNDLGRVAETGTVRVETARELIAHPTVHHAVATVTAELPPRASVVDLLAATLPGGSITGAPKIRAMEILEELEDVRRGPYCGVAGWIGHDGDCVLNILIRTLVVAGRQASFHVGGGIVADSDSVAEYDETLDKARALITALTRPTA